MEKMFGTLNEQIKDLILAFEIFSGSRRTPSVFGLFIYDYI